MKVWVVEFCGTDMSDCNAVFSTKEKAKDYVNREFKRMEDFWKNPKADEDENEYFCAYYFDLIDETINLNEKCSVVIHEQTVDIECE